MQYTSTYVSTYKLNQECLENFFFQLRCRGPNEHPCPLEAMKMTRMIILGKNTCILLLKCASTYLKFLLIIPALFFKGEHTRIVSLAF
jgi:hypothetical protein